MSVYFWVIFALYLRLSDDFISVRQHAERAICYRKSVCLSVTRVDQSKTVELRVMQFSPYSSPIPLLSAILSFIQKFRRDPPERASSEGGLGKRPNIVDLLTFSPGGSTSYSFNRC